MTSNKSLYRPAQVGVVAKRHEHAKRVAVRQTRTRPGYDNVTAPFAASSCLHSAGVAVRISLKTGLVEWQPSTLKWLWTEAWTATNFRGPRIIALSLCRKGRREFSNYRSGTSYALEAEWRGFAAENPPRHLDAVLLGMGEPALHLIFFLQHSIETLGRY